MKIKALAIAAATLLAAGTAEATMVAGWNFSQYSAGFLFDGVAAGPDVLDANFSDLDTDPLVGNGILGLGQGAEAFGRWYIDGSFGSFDTPLDFADPFRPATSSLTSNDTVPTTAICGEFNGCATSLLADGQAQHEDVAMNFDAVLSSVFEADLTSLIETGSSWVLSFAGQTQAGTSAADIGIEVSTNGGASFSNVGTANLTSVDTPFSFNLGGTDLNQILVRLNADAGTIVDNVALSATLSVPEPGTALLGLVGMAGLAYVGRRRRA
jgi:hypothetical protein